MAQIGSLSVKLGLVTVEWDKATDKAKQQAKDLQKSFNALGDELKTLKGHWQALGGAIGLGSLGMGALITATASFADKIDDLSKGFGISTGFALQFGDALNKSGLSADAAGKIIGKLFTSIEDAKLGNQSAVDQFRKIGITFSEIKALSPEDAIRRVMSALSNITDPIERVAMMRKQLGKGGIGLDVQQVDEILKNGVGGWQKYGDQLEKVSKIKDNLIASFNNLLIAVSAFLAPFSRDNIIAVERFQAAIAALGVAFAVSKVAAIVSMGQAFFGMAKGLLAVEAAAVGVNIVAGGMTPVGLLLKGGAALAAFITYDQMSGNAANRGRKNSTDTLYRLGIEPSAAGGGRGAVNPSLISGRADESTPEEKSAAAAAQAERIKTQGAELLANIPAWDKYATTINAIAVDSINAQQAIKVKALELQNTYKNNPTLLGLELGKLTEQSKQLEINKNKKIQEAAVTEQILIDEQERTRLEGYRTGLEIRTADATQRKLDRNQTAFDIQMKEIDNAKELLQIQIDANAALGSHEKLLAKENLEYQTSLEKLTKQMDALPEYITAMAGEELSKEAEANNNRIDALKTQIEFEGKRHSIRVFNLENERTLQYGATSALQTIMDDASNSAKIAGDMTTSLFGNMGTAIDNFVKTGKLAFGDFARSVIKDLIAIQLKAQATSLLGMAMKSIPGFGYTAGGSVASNLPDNIDIGGGWSPRASGGPVSSDSLYMVGEQGPEMFVPSSAGTIIPNGTLSGMGGGGQTINYNGPFIQSMSAIDTQSGLQFLAKNKQSVWSAYQSANRGIPMSR